MLMSGKFLLDTNIIIALLQMRESSKTTLLKPGKFSFQALSLVICATEPESQDELNQT